MCVCKIKSKPIFIITIDTIEVYDYYTDSHSDLSIYHKMYHHYSASDNNYSIVEKRLTIYCMTSKVCIQSAAVDKIY